ncbi:MAG: glycosyltransferase [Planctomycetaceae bacterium]
MTAVVCPANQTGSTDSAATGSVYVAIPLFNDWTVAAELLRRLDEHLPAGGRVLLIDDGSTEPCPEPFLPTSPLGFERVEVLTLRRNMGHQRAIALGLSFLEGERRFDSVVIMDGDGEDDPSDVPRLLAQLGSESRPKIVFAERTRRAEDLVFRLGYQAYRLVHRALTGVPVKVGNFSALNRQAVRRLVVSPDLWNHYAAAAFRSKTPVELVPTRRSRRIAGRSRMDLVGLVAHGLSAISVFREVVCTRLLLAATALLAVLCFGIAATVAIRLGTGLAIPGWATTAAGLLAAMVLQVLTLIALVVFSLLGSREAATVLPARDATWFLDGFRTLWPPVESRSTSPVEQLRETT